jgi:hypothetical protein
MGLRCSRGSIDLAALCLMKLIFRGGFASRFYGHAKWALCRLLHSFRHDFSFWEIKRGNTPFGSSALSVQTADCGQGFPPHGRGPVRGDSGSGTPGGWRLDRVPEKGWCGGPRIPGFSSARDPGRPAAMSDSVDSVDSHTLRLRKYMPAKPAKPVAIRSKLDGSGT